MHSKLNTFDLSLVVLVIIEIKGSKVNSNYLTNILPPPTSAHSFLLFSFQISKVLNMSEHLQHYEEGQEGGDRRRQDSGEATLRKGKNAMTAVVFAFLRKSPLCHGSKTDLGIHHHILYLLYHHCRVSLQNVLFEQR